MSMNSHPHTAKIYQFPRKTSVNAGAARQGAPATDHRGQAVATVEFGSGWYHEAALQAERVRKP